MTTNEGAAPGAVPTLPRLPRQVPGIARGTAQRPAAPGATTGVEAAGLLEWLFGDDVGGAIGDIVDTIPLGSTIHHVADAIYEAA